VEKVRPWCGQPSDRGRLKNEKKTPWAGSNKAGERELSDTVKARKLACYSHTSAFL